MIAMKNDTLRVERSSLSSFVPYPADEAAKSVEVGKDQSTAGDQSAAAEQQFSSRAFQAPVPGVVVHVQRNTGQRIVRALEGKPHRLSRQHFGCRIAMTTKTHKHFLFHRVVGVMTRDAVIVAVIPFHHVVLYELPVLILQFVLAGVALETSL